MAKKFVGENSIQEVITKTKALVGGKQDTIDASHKLSADLIQDGTTNKTVTATEKSTWNGKADTSALSSYLPLAGGTLTGQLQFNNIAGKILYWKNPTNNNQIWVGPRPNESEIVLEATTTAGTWGLSVVQSSIRPANSNSDGLVDLGESARRWRNLYLSGNLSDGTNTMSVANLNNYMKYTTTAPASANTDGLKIALLDSEPATKYAGWIYLIKES